VTALLDELGVREHAGLMLGRPAASVDFSAVITRVWDLEALAARYLSFGRSTAATNPTRWGTTSTTARRYC
jgi:phenylacetic acid degradation operon negative regulatory protein